MRRLRVCAAFTLLTLMGALIAAPAPGEQPLPMPRVVAGAEPKKVLAVEEFLTPPKEILDAVMATRGGNVSLTNLSPDGKKFLIVKSDGLPPIARLGCPCVHLAEMAFDPVAGRSRNLWVRSDDGFDLFYYADQRTVPVKIPAGARVSNPLWSPDGSRLAFFAHFVDATRIAMADTATGESRIVCDTPVVATLVTSFQWSKDGASIQTVLRPDDGKTWTLKPEQVSGPKVRVARDGQNPTRTYRYLLESPQDMKLLEHLITGQLASINVTDGRVTPIGNPAMINSVSASTDAKQFRVATVKKPFSYYVPFQRFGTLESVWDTAGKSLATLSDRPLRENEPAPTAVATPPTTGPGGGRFGGRKGAATPMPDPLVPPVDPTALPPQPTPNPDPDMTPRFGQQTDPDGKRDLAWRPDGAGLSYLQLEPARSDAKVDPKTPAVKAPEAKEPPRKDRVMLWVAPFGKDDAKIVFASANRIASAQYSDTGDWLFVTQTVDGARTIIAVDVHDPKTTHVVFKSGARAAETDPKTKTGGVENEQQPKGKGGFGANFGGAGAPTLLTRSGRGGAGVVRISSAGAVYLAGTDRNRGGEAGFARPYIDKVDIKSGVKTRIFEGKGDMLETVEAVDGDDVTRVFTTRQKTDVVPDSFVTDLSTSAATKLTNNVNRSPWHNDLKVARFQVTRVDGFRFNVKVTLPPKATGKLPALFWIYPREYTDQAAYNQGAGRAGLGGAGPGGGGRFTTPNPRSMTLLTLLGYAVVEPDVPIVGPAGRMNDNYVPDLRNSLWAVIDDLDKRGIIDRDRLAIGGHSYGAFSTANALAHTPFFKAGIAGDGNYNRTLTSMSFQTERRQLWDARETYLEMSPLLWANRVNGALLMYHGMEDANVGTDPINAEHLYMALDGLGKPAALYMYPYEGHGPIAKETTLDLWARWVAWLDAYVKNVKVERK